MGYPPALCYLFPIMRRSLGMFALALVVAVAAYSEPMKNPRSPKSCRGDAHA